MSFRPTEKLATPGSENPQESVQWLDELTPAERREHEQAAKRIARRAEEALRALRARQKQ